MISPVRIQATGLGYQYTSSGGGLRGIELEVQPGDWLALIGQNGSGKTTLAKLLGGLLRPSRGHIMHDGSDISSFSIPNLAGSVGLTLQDPDHQLFAATTRQEIAFGPRNLGLPLVEVERRTERALTRLDLLPYADQPPASLSFGLRRRVTVASLIALGPAVMILDEPTLGLETRSSQRMMRLLAELHHAGHTLITISHDLELLAAYSRSCAILHRGELIAHGRTEEILGDQALLSMVGMRPPALVELQSRLRVSGHEVPGRTPQDFGLNLVAMKGNPGP
jgi:energy-coupling factor transporter ATP-binding protein EcfA2